MSATEQNFIAARQIFADHCSSCRANDASGNSEIGRSVYPKAPDMRLPHTQQLSDGEIFHFTGERHPPGGDAGMEHGTLEGEKSSSQTGPFHPNLPAFRQVVQPFALDAVNRLMT